jgi:hypothetical protein
MLMGWVGLKLPKNEVAKTMPITAVLACCAAAEKIGF